MITNIKLFKESLSKDVAFDTKKRLLMEKINRLINVKSEIEKINNDLNIQNDKVRSILEKMNTHSIICNGVLIEIYKNFESNRFNDKQFFETLESNVDNLGQDVLDIANKYKEIYEYKKTIKFTKGNKNGTAKNAPRPDGDYTINPVVKEGFNDIVKTVGSFFRNLFIWARSFFKRANQNLINIQNNLASIGINVSITEKLNESADNKFEYLINMKKVKSLIETKDIYLYIGNSKYRRFVIDKLSKNNDLKLKDLHLHSTYSGSSNTLTVLVELIFCGFVVRNKLSEKNIIYNLTSDGYDLLIENKMTPTIQRPNISGVQASEETGNIIYNPAKPIEVQKPTYDTSYVSEALQISKEAIEINKNKLSLQTEEEMLKSDIVKLFEELNLLEIVVGDKIHKLYTQERTYLNSSEFQKAITTVDNVGEEIADLMTDLVSQHVKEFEVTGSIRQFSDTSNSPDGTLGAHFDHETKRVVTERKYRRKRINENILTKAWNWIKKSISKIINVRKNVESKLAKI